MARYIDADVLKGQLLNTCVTDDLIGISIDIGVKSAIKIIDRQPTADVAEVVRCKDCKKWTTVHTCKEFTAARSPMKGKITFMTEADDFCSYGERKDEGV